MKIPTQSQSIERIPSKIFLFQQNVIPAQLELRPIRGDRPFQRPIFYVYRVCYPPEFFGLPYNPFVLPAVCLTYFF